MTATLLILASADPGRFGIWLNLLAIPILLIVSASFSGSETALFSLTPVQLERAAASPNPFRRLAAELLRQPKRTLMILLVANTAVNTLLFANSYVLSNRLASQLGAWVTPVAGAVSILLVIVGGEVVPKIVSVHLADRLAPLAATLTHGAGFVAAPIGAAVNWLLVVPFERLVLGTGTGLRGPSAELSRAQLKTLLEMSRRSGTILPLEDAFLRAVVDLGHTRVRDVMVPRVEMTAYDVNESVEGLRELMRLTRHKKIPVYDGQRDNIIGLVYAKVLFLNPGKPLRQLVQPVRFVPELATCEQLLHHFRGTRTQQAIVVDEYGGVAGLVTLEDVLESIVGELYAPEDEQAEPELIAQPDGTYDISGQLNVHYWIDTFGLPAHAERVVTVGGLVMSRLGRPARVGDTVRFGNVELHVTRVKRRRVDRLRLRLLDAGLPTEDGA